MESKVVSLRFSSKLLAAAEAKAVAAQLTLSEWVRGLIERETGVAASMGEPGTKAMSKAKRRAIGKAGGEARAAKLSKKRRSEIAKAGGKASAKAAQHDGGSP